MSTPRPFIVAALALALIAAGCADPVAPGPNAAVPLAAAPTTPPVPQAPSTSSTSSTSSSSTSSTVPATTAAPICTACLDVTPVATGADHVVGFDLVDSSNPTAPRTSHVRIYLPTGTVSEVRIEGSYHRAGVPSAGEYYRSNRPRHTAVVVVGFASMTEGSPNFNDLPNTPNDVSAVLDVLTTQPERTGALPLDRVWYTGGSMAAVVGWLFTNACCRDPRIDALVLSSGFRIDEHNGFADAARYDFAASPPVLALHGTNDTTIPYDWFLRSLAPVTDPRARFVTVHGAGHGGLTDCPGVGAYRDAFVAHHLHGDPPPAFSAESCATLAPPPSGS